MSALRAHLAAQAARREAPAGPPRVPPRHLAAAGLLAGYVATVVLANHVTGRVGLVPAGFGLLVPAGTYCAALVLSLRDGIDRLAGLRWVWLGIAAGTLVSVATGAGRIALASGAAFALSEALDLLVYRRLRARGWRRALVVSNAAGAVLDTLLFLALAGFGLGSAAVAGQVLVKAVWMTGAALLLTEGARRAWRAVAR